MKRVFEIGDVKVTVEGLPEDADPDVDLWFHSVDGAAADALVAALGGVGALEPMAATDTALKAKTKPDDDWHGLEVYVVPEPAGAVLTEPRDATVRRYWRQQREAANV